MRHLNWLFEALELEYDKPNRTRLDAAIRDALGLDPSLTCYEVWAAIKALPAEEQESLASRVAPALTEQVDAPENALAPVPAAG